MPVHRLDIASGVVVVLVAIAALFAISVPEAFAWDVAKSTNGVVIVREASDTTTTCEVQVFYDLKSGYTAYGSIASYDASYTIKSALYSSTDAYEVELVPGYRRQLVRYGPNDSGPYRSVAVCYEPLQVTVENTQAISVSLEESLQVDVSLDSSASLNVSVTNEPTVTVGNALLLDDNGNNAVRIVAFEDSANFVALLGLLGSGVLVGRAILPWK